MCLPLSTLIIVSITVLRMNILHKIYLHTYLQLFGCEGVAISSTFTPYKTRLKRAKGHWPNPSGTSPNASVEGNKTSCGIPGTNLMFNPEN